MAYTKAEKEKLIRQFKTINEKRIEQLRQMSERNVTICENKVLRRLNSVSVTLWNVKIKDVLEIERMHQPTLKNLLNDIQKLHAQQVRENTSNNATSRSRINSSRDRISKLRID